MKINYIDDVLSLRNSKHLLIELEIKDTVYTASRTVHTLTHTSTLTVRAG